MGKFVKKNLLLFSDWSQNYRKCSGEFKTILPLATDNKWRKWTSGSS